MKSERAERTTQVLVNIDFQDGYLQSPKSQNLGCCTITSFFNSIGSAFGSNTGNTATSQLNNGMTFWEIFGRVYTTRGGITTISNGPGGGGLNTNPSGGPGGPLNLSDFYENLEQAPVVQDLVNLLNECLTDSEDQQAALDLIQDEYLQCLDHFGEIGNPNLLIQQYLCTAAKVLDQLEFRDLSSSCAVNQLRARTIQLLLGDPFSRFVKLKNNFAMTEMIWDFLQENQFDIKSKEYVSVFFSLHDENSNYKFERFEELFNLVENNPNALIDDCPPQVQDWSDLASFTVTGLPLQRIQNANGIWDVQSIQDASGARVNLDYFSIHLERMPTINGNQVSPEELFQYFRLNINDFANKFTPFPGDEALWSSSNPLSTIISIRLAVVPGTNITAADGDVICSQYEPCCWIFTTLWSNGASGIHPVSGNRKFGFTYENGIFVLYTQGADRATTWYHAINDSQTAFNEADDFWRGMQANFRAFVEANGGWTLPGNRTSEVTIRPNWAAIKDLLISPTPITYVPCN